MMSVLVFLGSRINLTRRPPYTEVQLEEADPQWCASETASFRRDLKKKLIWYNKAFTEMPSRDNHVCDIRAEEKIAT